MVSFDSLQTQVKDISPNATWNPIVPWGRDGEGFTAVCPSTGHEVRPPSNEDAEAEAARTSEQEEVIAVLRTPQPATRARGNNGELHGVSSGGFETTELDAMLAAIVTDPCEDTGWLALSDWFAKRVLHPR